MIAVSSSNFGNLPAGTLSSSLFALSGHETSATRFIFDSASGVLSYDADGSGQMVPTDIATIQYGGALTYHDILVIN